MDIKPPKKPRNIDFGKNPRFSSDIRRVKRVSSTLKQKPSQLINSKPVRDIKNKIANRDENLPNSIKKSKLTIFTILLLSIVVSCLYFANITNFHPISPVVDQSGLGQHKSFDQISKNILYAPEKIIELGLFKAGISSELSSKLVSVSTVLLAVALFYILIRQWVSFRITILSTLLFASSTWTILHARDIIYSSMFFLCLPVLFLAALAIKNKASNLATYGLILALATCLYVPGFVWLFLCGLAFYFKNIREYFGKQDLSRRFKMIGLFILPVAPLIYGLSVQNTRVLKEWLGLPAFINPQIALDNLIALPNQLFISGLEEPMLWLQNTPIIEPVTLILIITGLVYIFNRENFIDLKKSSILFILLGIALIALNGYVYISILIPLAYIFTAIGLTFLVEQWFHIFPKNPLARSTGLSLVIVLVMLAASYHVVRYFIAWPRVVSVSDTIKEENKE